MRQGAYGGAWEWVASLTAWGFALEDITMTFHLWHGSQDPYESQTALEDWTARIPRAQVTTWDDSGHLVVADHWAEILTTLIE